jgi:starvation-inducible DNA-binding protein
LAPDAVRDIAAALTTLLADMFAIYVKAKNFHWHMSGPYFRDQEKNRQLATGCSISG